MQISIKVIPQSSQNKIFVEKDVLKIKITDAPHKGKANAKIIKILAQHFKVSKSQIEIIKGLTSRNKIVKINTEK